MVVENLFTITVREKFIELKFYPKKILYRNCKSKEVIIICKNTPFQQFLVQDISNISIDPLNNYTLPLENGEEDKLLLMKILFEI